MNEWLAQMYGTNGANREELEKQASLELFAKLAAKHNIDLSQLSDAQVQELYAQTFPEFAKTAEDEDDEEEDEDKKEKAEEYVEEKKAFQEKFAEADIMGRVMAHAFTQEREEIEKEAGGLVDASGKAISSGGRLASAGRSLRGLGERGLAAAREYGGKAKDIAARGSGARDVREGASMLRKGLSESKTAPGHALAKEHVMKGLKQLGVGGAKATGVAAGTAATGGGAYAAHKAMKGKEKKSSAEAFEELAATQGIKIAAAAGFDADEAYERVNAVYTLGLQETEKVASVQNLDDALHIRGLEYLEVAGYPVDWSEIYGE